MASMPGRLRATRRSREGRSSLIMDGGAATIRKRPSCLAATVPDHTRIALVLTHRPASLCCRTAVRSIWVSFDRSKNRHVARDAVTGTKPVVAMPESPPRTTAELPHDLWTTSVTELERRFQEGSLFPRDLPHSPALLDVDNRVAAGLGPPNTPNDSDLRHYGVSHAHACIGHAAAAYESGQS